MSKKKSALLRSGAAQRAARGLKSVLVGVRPDVHAAIRLAAAARQQTMAVWMPEVMEEAARTTLEAFGIPWPATTRKE